MENKCREESKQENHIHKEIGLRKVRIYKGRKKKKIMHKPKKKKKQMEEIKAKRREQYPWKIKLEILK